MDNYWADCYNILKIVIDDNDKVSDKQLARMTIAISIACLILVVAVTLLLASIKRDTKRITSKTTLPAGHFQIVGHEIEQWTPQDVALLRVYFKTANGQKFYKLCNNLCLSEAVRECAGDNAVPTAAGMDKLLRFQQNLCSTKMETDLISRESGAQDSNITEHGERETVLSET